MDRQRTVRRREQAFTITNLYGGGDIFNDGNSEEILQEKAPIIIFQETIATDPDAKVKLTPSGLPFYLQLPDGSERCKVYTQFYRLVNGAKHWKKENIELRVGMYFAIYSPGAEKFFLRQVHEDLNVEKLKQYIRDKNLYLINKDS